MPLDKIKAPENDFPIYVQLYTFNFEKARLVKSNFQKLFEDIEKNGLREPIKVHSNRDGTFRILDGNHRFQVYKILGFKTIPCLIN